MKKSRISEFVEELMQILSLSPNLHPVPSGVDVIVNPVAGKVAHHKTLGNEIALIRRFLGRLREGAAAQGERLRRLEATLHISQRPGQAKEIVKGIIERVARLRERRVVLSVGGDGTHEEILSVLYDAEPHVLDAIDVFRVPMGTGNDAADAGELNAACEILARAGARKRTGAVRIQPAGLPAMYSFNIASLGIDAFVSDLTNRLKAVLPGDAYKVIADIATLFYSPPFRKGPVRMELERVDGTREEVSGRFMLIAMGLSGRRTYGGEKPVLPGEENLCAFPQVGIVRKVALKQMLYAGTHALQPETLMRSVRKVSIHFEGRLPLQADGESTWLAPENFPVVMEILDPRVPILTAAG